MTTSPTTRESWAAWLNSFGAENFFDSFLRNAQGARGTCTHCGEAIMLDIVEGGGVPDWRSEDGDYGCDSSPDTDDECCGSHLPERLS